MMRRVNNPDHYRCPADAQWAAMQRARLARGERIIRAWALTLAICARLRLGPE